MKFSNILGIFLMGVFMISCTKDAPYKSLPKSQELVELSTLDALSEAEFAKVLAKPSSADAVENDWLTVTAYGKSSRTSMNTRPYGSGTERLVRFVKAKDAIKLISIDTERRFQDNPTNHRTILSIPAKYVEYRCAADAFGECQNKEEENSDIPWEQRKYAELDFAKIEAVSLDTLPLEITNLFSQCYSVVDSKLINYELSEGVLNIQVEKTFNIDRLSSRCLGKTSNISIDDLNFKVQYFHSIIKLNKLASKDYKRVFYPGDDSNTFGFFTTEIDKLSLDNRPIQGTEVVYMNRWNPERRTIPYYLSDEFYKEENKLILKATQVAVQNVNDALKKSGSKMQIDLKSDKGKNPNDLRNSMIVMVEDPIDSGVIGYGPSVANPRTGELVHAHTAMFLGSIKRMINRAYEEIRHEILLEKASQSHTPTLVVKANTQAEKVGKGTGLSSEIQGYKPLFTLNLPDVMTKMDHLAKQQSPFLMSEKQTGIVGQAQKQTQMLQKDFRRDQTLEDRLFKDWSKECFFSGEMLSITAVKSLLGNRPELKPWLELTEAEQQEIMDLLLPNIWITTLVHELGHNLGLRHNFAGSEDAANFYTEAERAQLGLEEVIPYSSMMEYTYRTVSGLPTLGKYDIAALQFGYARKLELDDGKILEFTHVPNEPNKPAIQIEDKIFPVPAEEFLSIAGVHALGLDLKNYEYCTDEHADANPNCNRFDEGQTHVQMAAHMIKAYNELYKFRYFRNGRQNFSLIDEGARASTTEDAFLDLRMFYERYEMIKNTFGIKDDNALWENNQFLKDIRQATVLTGRFLLNVMLTPDILCAVSEKDSAKLAAVVPLTVLSARSTHCFADDVQEVVTAVGQDNGLDLVVVGQTGKSFQSRKSPENSNPSVDQVDIQGIWVDKLLAQQMLLSRELGSITLDKFTQSYLDMPELASDIKSSLKAIVRDEVQLPVVFTDANGIPKQFEVTVRDEQTGESKVQKQSLVGVGFSVGDKSHIIDIPIAGGLLEHFHLPETQTYFRWVTVGSIENLVPSVLHAKEATETLDMFTVHNSITEDLLKPGKEFVIAQIQNKKFAATEENGVAFEILVETRIGQELSKIQPEALEKLAETLPESDDSPEELIKKAGRIIRELDQERANGQVTASEEVAKTLGKQAITLFLSGQLISEETALSSLNILL